MEPDVRQLRMMCRGRYFYFRFTSAILFFTAIIIIYLCRTYVLWIGRPRKCKYSRWNFSNMFPVLGAILDFRMSVHDTYLHTRAKTINKTRI